MRMFGGSGRDRDLSTPLRFGLEDNGSKAGFDGDDDGAHDGRSIQFAGKYDQNAARVLRGLFFLYKHTVSPMLHALSGPGAGCRFQPTCSEYAVLAWHIHGPFRGSWLACRRLARCHPFASGGFDPVPGTHVPATEKTHAI